MHVFVNNTLSVQFPLHSVSLLSAQNDIYHFKDLVSVCLCVGLFVDAVHSGTWS